MNNDKRSATCFAAVGSMTQALKAQHALTRAAVFSHVEKADAKSARRGCAYGVCYPCTQEAQVREVLRGAGIRIRATEER